MNKVENEQYQDIISRNDKLRDENVQLKLKMDSLVATIKEYVNKIESEHEANLKTINQKNQLLDHAIKSRNSDFQRLLKSYDALEKENIYLKNSKSADDQYRYKIERLSNAVKSLNEINFNLEKQKNQLLENQRFLDEDNENLRQIVEQNENNFEAAEQYRQYNIKLESDVNELKTIVKQLYAEQETLIQENQQLKNDLFEAGETLKSLDTYKHQCEMLETERSELSLLFSQAYDDKEQLTQENDRLTTDLQQYQLEVEKFQHNTDSLVRENELLGDLVKQVDRERELLLQDNEQLQANVQQLQNELEDINILQEENKKFVQENELLGDLVKQVDHERESLLQDNEQLQTNVQQLQNELEDIINLREENKKLTQENELLSNLVKQLDEEREGIEQEKEQLQNGVEHFQKELENFTKLQQAHDSLQNEKELLSDLVKQVDGEREFLNQENEHLRNLVTQFESNAKGTKASKQKHSQAETERNQLIDLCKQLEAERESLSQEVVQLRNEMSINKGDDTDYSQLHQKIAMLEKENDFLNTQIEKNEIEHETLLKENKKFKKNLKSNQEQDQDLPHLNYITEKVAELEQKNDLLNRYIEKLESERKDFTVESEVSAQKLAYLERAVMIMNKDIEELEEEKRILTEKLELVEK